MESAKRESTEEPSVADIKRQKLEDEEETPKVVPTKTNQQIVTLNYTAKLNTTDKMEHDECILELTEDGQDDDDDVEETEENSDEKINPILKVDQIPTDVFPCTQCQRSFPLKQLLDLHMINHDRERSYECELCTRKFFTKYDLSKHLQTHSNHKPFTCVVCNKQFSRETLLHRHEKIHTDTPKYLCTTCDRTYLTKDDLDAHVETHKKKRPYTCNICDKGFVFKQGLQRHIASHSEDKPHKCDYCEASFSSAIKLRRHVTSHAGLRPYPCKVCARTFLLSHHLSRHMRSHYSAKSQPIGQHKCDVCSMAFRRKDSLINHSAIHSMCNLRCVICNTAFDTAKEVKEHITTHLSGLPYPCEKCDYSFETQDQLEAHEIKHAEMEYEEQIEREVTMETISSKDIDEEDDEYFEDDEEIEELPPVRRSKRIVKIKNYAEFLKDELGSDIEDELMEESESKEDDYDSVSSDTIKPIVRSEGTKVYTRKQSIDKNKQAQELPQLPEIDGNQGTTLENLNLSKHVVNALTNKQFVDMKIGQTMVRVQKLIMTKAEIEAMAREGKIEVKGETIILKKQAKTLNQNAPVQKEQTKPKPIENITIENIIDDTKPSTSQRIPVKKTYMKKTQSNNGVNNKNDTKEKEITDDVIKNADCTEKND